MTKLTDEQKREIYELYLDPTVKLKDIAATYGINNSEVSRVARKYGAPARQTHSEHNMRKSGGRKCPTCKRQINIKDASFCPYCGADVRSPRELLISRVMKAMNYTKFLPESAKDEFCTLLIDIQTELKKGN